MVSVVDEMKFVQVAERMRHGIRLLRVVQELVGEVHEIEPDVTPELLTVIRGLDGTSEAMVRAVDFLNTRIEVARGEGA